MKIKKLYENGAGIAPATITAAVVDDATGKPLKELLAALSGAISSGKTDLAAAVDALNTAIAATSWGDLAGAISNIDTILEGTDSDEIIDKWKEIEAFLQGISDTETLTGLLNDTLTQAKAYADEAVANAEYDLPVATSSKLGGVLSGGDISVGTSGTVTVSHATSADTATKADTATDADHATSADTATTATSADYATSAGTADEATHASSADTATTATTATNADHATSADTATSADSATKAEQDALGNVISTTYATKDEVQQAGGYTLPVATSSVLGGVLSGGDITVGSSGSVTVSHATSADSATKATQDGDGNVITDTYATASDLDYHLAGWATHCFCDPSNVNKYMKVCTITNQSQYINSPIRWFVSQRNRRGVILTLVIDSSASIENAIIRNFCYEGDSLEAYVGTTLVDDSTRTYDIYIKPSVSYDAIAMTPFNIDEKHMEKAGSLTFDYPGYREAVVEELPEDAIQAVLFNRASQLGSATVGSGTQPIYLSSGTATASSSTVGSSTAPVYLSSGTITACGSSLAVDITGNAATATSATKATQDGDGNVISTTYLTAVSCTDTTEYPDIDI